MLLVPGKQMANVTHYEDVLMSCFYKCQKIFEEYKNLIKDLCLREALH